MKRWAQWGALGLGGVVLLAGAIGAYLVATFDADRYKGVLIEWVREHRQRELRIEGPLELKLWPRLQVRLQDVSLSEHRRPQETFLALRDARLAVDVWPLLRKSLVIDRIEAHGLTLRYLRDAQGRRNIDDLLGRDDGPEDSAGKSGPVHFDVAALDISDATVTVHDELGDCAAMSSSGGSRAGAWPTSSARRSRSTPRSNCCSPACKGGCRGRPGCASSGPPRA